LVGADDFYFLLSSLNFPKLLARVVPAEGEN